MRKQYIQTFRRYIAGFSVLALVTASIFGAPAQVQAATTGSLYSYDFATPTLTTPITNGAAANTAVPLNLYGTWSQSAFGIHFAGDKVGNQSVAYARPASGSTLSVAATQAVGAAIKIKYQAPVGSTCFADSNNLTQVGRFGAGLSQIKLQFSNCGKSTVNVFPECRMAGVLSTTNDVPVTGTQPLVDGGIYVIKCMKAPDPASGQATLQLKTVRVDTGLATTDTFAITPTGAINSGTAYLSVGNKYALPAPSANTDQFVGDVAKVAYCSGATLAAATTCLDTEVSDGTALPPSQPTQFIGNQSIETDTTGWTGVYNSASKNSRVSGGYSGLYSLRSVNNTATTGSNGFIDKPRWFDGTSGKTTVAGKAYTGSVWVKPDQAGQKISLYLREVNAAGTTVGSRTVPFTTTTTNWVQITNIYTAVGAGNSIGFYVYASNVAAQKGFNADMMSLTTQ